MAFSPLQGGILRRARPLDTNATDESIPTLAEALDAFDADLYLSGRSTATRQTYRYLLKPLRSFEPVTEFTSKLCRSQLADRIRRKQALATVVTAHGALSAFSKWLTDNHHLSESPMKGIPAPKIKPKPHRYLSMDEMKRLWQAALTSRRKPAENCLILLLLAEGLRANELVSLRWSDVKEDRIIVAFGKGGTVRSIALTEALNLALAARRGLRTGLEPVTPRAALMHTRDSAIELPKPRPQRITDDRIIPCNVNSLEARLALLGKRAKVAHVHPHLFRHTFASMFLMEGGIESMEALRQLGGWSARSTIPSFYARSVLEEAALRRSREINLSAKLFGGEGGI